MPDSILKRLGDIFSVWVNAAGTFTVQAEHYGYSTALESLTATELRQLGDELIAMADEMEPESEQEDIDPSEAEMHDWNNHPALTAEQRGGVK